MLNYLNLLSLQNAIINVNNSRLLFNQNENTTDNDEHQKASKHNHTARPIICRLQFRYPEQSDSKTRAEV